MATRRAHLALSAAVRDALCVLRAAAFDLVFVETAGIGQSDSEIVDLVDLSLYVMTPEFGAPSQLEKIDMLELADLVVLNKFDRHGARDALRDVRKQWKRNHAAPQAADAEIPVFPTIARQWDDPGTERLYEALRGRLAARAGDRFGQPERAGTLDIALPTAPALVPPARRRYLAEIAEQNRAYRRRTEEQARSAARARALAQATEALRESGDEPPLEEAVLARLEARRQAALAELDADLRGALERWPDVRERYQGDEQSYSVRGTRDPGAQPHRDALAEPGCPRWRCRAATTRRSSCASCAARTCRDASRSRRGCSRSAVPNEDPDAHVRGRGRTRSGRTVASTYLAPAASGGRRAALDGLRQRDPLRPRSRPAARHLRQGRQLGRLHLHPGRRQEALLGLRPVRSDHLGVAHHQRPGADRARLLPERRHRPAGREAPARDGSPRGGAGALRGPAVLPGSAARRPRRLRARASSASRATGPSTPTPTRASAPTPCGGCAAPCRPTS